MNTRKRFKLKKMLTARSSGEVILSKHLLKLGISRDLQKVYRKNGWLESVGPGAYKRPGDQITWQGALAAIQQQADVAVHAGASTALSLHGLSHYLRLSRDRIFLFAHKKTVMPKWFMVSPWKDQVNLVKTSFLPEGMGLTIHEQSNVSIKLSTPERAIMENLYLVPAKADMEECLRIMEGLSNLRPQLLQTLLESCESVKVKRLFLFLAEKANHQWLSFLNQEDIDLGKGDRSLAKGGVYNAKFKIVVPEELAKK
jgi:hypothetical protein